MNYVNRKNVRSFFSPHEHSRVQEMDERGEIFGEHRENYRFNVIATTFNDWNQLNAMFGEMDWANGSPKVKPNRQLLIVVSTAVFARVCVFYICSWARWSRWFVFTRFSRHIIWISYENATKNRKFVQF